jgi:hypothetical protein
MASKYFPSLTLTAACLSASISHPQSLISFDSGRFYAAAAGDKATGSIDTKEFAIDGLGILSRVVPQSKDKTYFGSISSLKSYTSKTPTSSTFQPILETESVHPDLTSVQVPCGPSPASIEEIKTMVVTTANRYSVDPDFALAVTWTESRFDRVRNSPKGARGPMQLMPQTARRFDVADVCDPVANIDGGVRYLRRLLDEFKNPIIAAAAYNAGEQAIYDSGGVPAYPETVRYVSSVINHQFGFPAPITARADRKSPIDISGASTIDVIGARAPEFVSGVMQF